MNHSRIRACVYPAVLLILLALSLPLVAQGQNLVKDVMDHKGQIDWKNVAAGTIPSEVCGLLNACGSGAAKLASLKSTTEGGQLVRRGMFLTRTGNPKEPDAIILIHYTTNEVYYFLLGPDGTPQKTAYAQYGKTYELIANELAKPVFNKDQKAWQEWLTTVIGGAKKS